MLYREGDPAEYVYLVKEGQFEVTRMLTYNEDQSAKNKKIFADPMKANKFTGCSQLSNLKKIKQQQVYVSSVCLIVVAVPLRKRKHHRR